MLFTFQRFLFVSFLIIYLITIDARSIDDPFDNDDDRNLFVTLANYEHRFERSMDFKKLRWAIGNLNNTAKCEACDLLVPEVIFSS
jgi:hypothetical protein